MWSIMLHFQWMSGFFSGHEISQWEIPEDVLAATCVVPLEGQPMTEVTISNCFSVNEFKHTYFQAGPSRGKQKVRIYNPSIVVYIYR